MEKQILVYAKTNGKSPDEAKEAIERLRSGRPYTTTIPAQPVETPTSQIVEAAQQGIETVEEGASQVMSAKSPTEAITGNIKAGAGVVQTLTAPLAPLFSPIGKLIGYVSDKLSNIKGVQDFSTTPAGEATAAGAELLSDVGTIAGAAVGAKGLPKVAGVASEAAGAVSGALEGIQGVGSVGIKEAASKAVNPAAIMQRVARISKNKQSAFEERAGQSVGQYLVDRGVFGDVESLTQQLFNNFIKSKNAADKALASLPGQFKARPVQTALDELFKRETTISTPGAPSRDFVRVRELRNKYSQEGLTHSEINEVKRLYEHNVRLDYIKENAPTSVERANSIDSALRRWQIEQSKKQGLTNLQDINRETMLARQLLDDLGAEYAGAAGNNAITLTDWIVLAGGDPGNVAAFLTKKALSSKGVMSGVAKAVAPAPKSGTPFPIFEQPSLTGYADFIRSIEGRATPTTQQR
ncbi:MAG: hypothetical protein Q6360_13115 [Candidatus Brocadiales bacterium]|nr:hypothetical protein [Candidatus Brocadiales bacterium]